MRTAAETRGSWEDCDTQYEFALEPAPCISRIFYLPYHFHKTPFLFIYPNNYRKTIINTMPVPPLEILLLLFWLDK